MASSCIFRGAKWLSVDDSIGVGVSFLMLADIALRSGVVLAVPLPLQALRPSGRAPLPAH